MVKVGSMRRTNRILLMVTVFAVGVQGANASIWKHRKAGTPSAPAESKSAVAGMTLNGVEADAAHVTLRTTGAPAYTSYSPSPTVFVVDLTGTAKSDALAIPSRLPAGVSSISAEEATEMGVRLTRVTFRLSQPLSVQAAANDNAVVVTIPVAAVEASTAAAVATAAAASTPEKKQPVEAVAISSPAKVSPAPAASAPVNDPPPVEMVLPAQTAPAVAKAAPSSRPARVLRDIATSGSGSNFAVSMDGDGAIAYKSFVLQNPPRLVLDLTGIRNEVRRTSLPVSSAVVSRVRVSQFKPMPDPVTRVVLDLSSNSRYDIATDGDQLRVSFGSVAAAGAVASTSRPAEQRVAEVTARPSAAPPKATPAEPLTPVAVAADPAPFTATAQEYPEATAVITSNSDQTPPDTRRQTTSAVGATTAAHSAATMSSGSNVFDTTPASSAQPIAIGREPQSLSAGAGGRSLASNQKVYSGEPLSLSLKDADIRDVLRTFADLTGLNIAVDPQVSGRVTVNFTDVPWDQALEIILSQNGLSWTLNGNVLRVGTSERLRAEREAARKLDEEERLNVPLETYIFKLSYAKAVDAQALIKDVASPRAKIIVDNRTNQLVVSEIPMYLKTIASLIETIDVPTRQVMIEARIVEASKTFQQQYGFQWGFQGAADPSLGTGTGLIFPNRITYTGGPFDFGPGNSVLQMHLSDVLGTFNLDFALNALEFEGLVKVISAPRVTTQDNQAAEIQSGLQIPFQTRINFTTTISYVDATLRLGVTPQITEAGTVIMDISVQKNSPATGLAIEGAAGTPLQTRTAKTRLMVRDGGTAVIGGIYQVSDNNSQTRLPFVHKIPFLGNLFKTHNISTTRDELLIFITPRIIRGV